MTTAEPAEVRVDRPVRRWWQYLWPADTLRAREAAAMANLDAVVMQVGELVTERERLRKKVRDQRAELRRLNKAHAALWAGSRFTVFAQERAKLMRLARTDKPSPLDDLPPIL